jgi:hypothetical protein
MSLMFDPPPFPLVQMVEQARHALERLGEGVTDDALLSFLGPVRCFEANAAQFARGATRGAIKGAGWRGLLMFADEPVGVLDIYPPDPGEAPKYVVRGREVAQTLALALDAAREIADREKGMFEVRVLSVPSSFLTAIWLKGRRSWFIPTRAGLGARPRAEPLGRRDFLKLFRACLRSRRSPPRSARGTTGLLQGANGVTRA